jgi:hypothetical protein
MGIGPEDIYYEIDGHLVCVSNLTNCRDWEELARLIGEKDAKQIKEDGFELWQADLFYEGCEQRVIKNGRELR